MSEEKRFIKNKKILALSISLVAVCILAGVFGISFIMVSNNYNDLSGDYDDLYEEYETLLSSFNELNDIYFILTGEYIELENDFIALELALIDMTAERDDLETERDELLQDIIDLNAEIALLKLNSTGLQEIITGLETTIAGLNTEIINLGNTIIGLNGEISTLTAERDALQTALDNLGAEKDALEQYYLGLIADLNSDIAALEAERDNLVIDLATMTTERDNLVIALSDMTLERDNLQLLYDGLLIDIAVLQVAYDALEASIIALQADYDNLEADYNALLGDYQILSDAKDALQTQFDALSIAYDYTINTIKQSILPVQYNIFAEAVRRYYIPIYLEGLSGKEYWMAFAEFCRDIVLHDSKQYNAFSTVSNIFSDALKYGYDTMLLSDAIMDNVFDFCGTINYWDMDLSGNELIGIDTVVQECINNIDYEYDLDITTGQETFDWDYIKFPVETAFRTMGDCEDQAILCSAYLESCGFETTIAISHDPSHPTLGEFYHGHLLVRIENPSAFWTLYPTTSLWTIPFSEDIWCWLDPTWDIPFGSTPSWLQDYIDFGIITEDIMTLAFCNINGAVGENSGLTCVMPT